MDLKSDHKFICIAWENQIQWNFITTGQLMFPPLEHSCFIKSQPKTQSQPIMQYCSHIKSQKMLHPQDTIKKMDFLFSPLSAW